MSRSTKQKKNTDLNNANTFLQYNWKRNNKYPRSKFKIPISQLILQQQVHSILSTAHTCWQKTETIKPNKHFPLNQQVAFHKANKWHIWPTNCSSQMQHNHHLLILLFSFFHTPFLEFSTHTLFYTKQNKTHMTKTL